MQRFYSLMLCIGISLAATAQQKKDLSPDDYGKWQTLSAPALSANGDWAAYEMKVQEDNDTLYIVNRLSGQRYALEFGTRPEFSEDNKWVAWNIGVSYKEAEKMQEQRQPVRFKMGLMNLQTGRKTVVDDVRAFDFSKNGKFLAISLIPPKDNKDKGAVLLLRNLTDSSTRTIGNVTAHAFNKKSDHLAYIVESANQAGNSVELFNLDTYTLKVIASDTLSFSRLSWSKDGDGLAFYKTVKHEDFEEENAQVYVYAPLHKNPRLTIFDPVKQPGFPKGMRIHPGASLHLTNNLSSVYFGISEWTAKPKKGEKKEAANKDTTGGAPKDSTAIAAVDKDTTKAVAKKEGPAAKPAGKDKPAAVDIWHWKDADIQPRQKITYAKDKEQSYQSVWNIAANTFYQLASDSVPTADFDTRHPYGLIFTDKKYKPAFKEDFADVYLVNTQNGERKLIGEKIAMQYGMVPSLSPDGKFALWYRDKQWHAYNTASGQTVNLTAKIPTVFENFRDDHPAVKPPFGTGGWIKGDKEVLLYDEYDVYAVKPDGKGFRKLTNGTADEIQHRVLRLDQEEPFLDDSKPVFFYLYGDKSKFTGYAKMEKGKLSRVLYEDLQLSRPVKARDADVFLFSRMDYDRSPELFTTKAFEGEQQIAASNPQQKDYKWGKSELVSFTNRKGKKMQGALFYPADYQPGKKYPMIVYIYETLSNTVHGYMPPSRRSAYNTTNFTTNGYFIFRPDIVYDINDPGMSAVNCVVPAVEEVLKTGMIDRDKIGLMGHSWGAYQTSFIITQTDLFKAACAGAPLTNLISMSLAIYWNSGVPDQKIFETSQGRFDGPWYERMQEHMRNSPIYQAANIKAPLLVAFGDKDGAVDWHQGIEMYGTMRRMEKPHVMLVYADENHGLAKKENQIDYQQRQREWFDHYLLGKEAPKWITEGVTYLDKMKAQENAK